MTNEQLAKQIQDGGEDLALQLWEQIKRYVAKTAIRWYLHFEGGRGVEVCDLIQSGYLAMVDAVQTFEDGNGSFISWLTYYLQNEFSALYGVRTERTKRDPLNGAASLDAPIGDEDGMTIAETVVDPDGENGYQQIEDNDYIRALREALEKALADIPPKSAETIHRKWLDNQTRLEIAEDLGVSYNEIVRREKKGFSLLRRPQTIEKLREFNPYSCTGYQAWYRSGMSVQERFVIMNDNTKQIRRLQTNE